MIHAAPMHTCTLVLHYSEVYLELHPNFFKIQRPNTSNTVCVHDFPLGRS